MIIKIIIVTFKNMKFVLYILLNIEMLYYNFLMNYIHKKKKILCLKYVTIQA